MRRRAYLPPEVPQETAASGALEETEAHNIALEVEQETADMAPLIAEPADCRLAPKTGKFKINRKEHPYEMNVRSWVIVNLVGGLDNNN